MAYSLSEQIEAVVREIGFRKRVYVRRVAEHTMSQDHADKQIGLMEAVKATLESLDEKERLL